MTSRDDIEPTYRVPLAPPFRNLSAVVGRTVAYSNLADMKKRLAAVGALIGDPR